MSNCFTLYNIVVHSGNAIRYLDMQQYNRPPSDLCELCPRVKVTSEVELLFHSL